MGWDKVQGCFHKKLMAINGVVLDDYWVDIFQEARVLVKPQLQNSCNVSEKTIPGCSVETTYVCVWGSSTQRLIVDDHHV